MPLANKSFSLDADHLFLIGACRLRFRRNSIDHKQQRRTRRPATMGQRLCSRHRGLLICALLAALSTSPASARFVPTAAAASHPGVVQGAVAEDPSSLWSAGSAMPSSLVTVLDTLTTRPLTLSQQTANDDNNPPQTATPQADQIAALRDGSVPMRGVGLGG